MTIFPKHTYLLEKNDSRGSSIFHVSKSAEFKVTVEILTISSKKQTKSTPIRKLKWKFVIFSICSSHPPTLPNCVTDLLGSGPTLIILAFLPQPPLPLFLPLTLMFYSLTKI